MSWAGKHQQVCRQPPFYKALKQWSCHVKTLDFHTTRPPNKLTSSSGGQRKNKPHRRQNPLAGDDVLPPRWTEHPWSSLHRPQPQHRGESTRLRSPNQRLTPAWASCDLGQDPSIWPISGPRAFPPGDGVVASRVSDLACCSNAACKPAIQQTLTESWRRGLVMGGLGRRGCEAEGMAGAKALG